MQEGTELPDALSSSDMDDSSYPTDSSSWASPSSAKARTAVQRSVTELLDALAPERVLQRVSKDPKRIEQHRSPEGCVLQAADCAITVSWFPDPTPEQPLGELHVIVWHGKVTRRGAPPQKKATVVDDLILHPIEPPRDDRQWQATDGTSYSTATLVEKSLALLEEQIARS